MFCKEDFCEAKHEMHSVFKFSDFLFALKSDGPPIDEALGQNDIFVRSVGQADFGQMYPLVEASSHQEWYNIR